ncbi:hypothetical protein FB45DRAFT_69321 [Roridomyces roridus]|uniref:alpha-1,6-mannosyl-glycoprotein 6-beta-N-acetylglucosaminyltransferase n=1 Tax=Roridomyces roridus TaxID=1738132 RepID=A0AAD7FKQ0_9AGAR|nr:hypothetical protein FB45DRAFT_69321 [Roridomyces roridus]
MEDTELAHNPWRYRTRRALRELLTCIERNDCKKNQKKVVIVESMYFFNNMRGAIGGEDIWANSTMLAMKKLGYTVLYAEEMTAAVELYRIIPSLVRMVIVNDWHAFLCWKEIGWCLQSIYNPTGIPAYKLFSFYFWSIPNHPLGPKWVLSPEPYHEMPNPLNFTYLGYSVEHACSVTPFVPHSERPNQAWVLAKLLNYFSPDKSPWVGADFDDASELTGVTYALGAGLDDGHTMPPADMLPAKYVNHDRMDKSVFMSRIAQSRVLIGVGNPTNSPTPYDALCLGVPFINPYDDWGRIGANGDQNTQWDSQHPFMSMLGKPYVYNVRRGDHEGFVQAVEEALANPIPRYIPERMRIESLMARMDELMDTDWEEEMRKQAEWCDKPCGCTLPCNLQ